MKSQSKRRFRLGFKKATFISSQYSVSVVIVIAQANAHHFPSHQKWAKFLLVSLKTFVKSAQNRLLSSKICPENFRGMGFSQNWPILLQICLQESHEILTFFP